ncbi:MAG: ParB/RepB/Spo0J family partition protein [Planctomycetota bacterium]
MIHLPVGSIIPNRFQPREQFDDDRLSELARSIARDGVMQPILVRPGSAGGSTGGRYELIAGERRWRAAKLAGLTRVPALVRPLEDRDAGAWALIENVHRQDLGPMEKADAIAGMIARDGLTQAEAAERLLLDRSTVANLVRLVGLEPAIRSLLNAGSLNTGHGKALAGLPAGATRVELAQAAAAGGWSVRRLERAAAESKAGKHPERGSANTPGTDDQSRHRLVLASMEKQLGESLNSRVRIRANKSGTKGAICIDFYGNDHFEGLVERLGVRPDV